MVWPAAPRLGWMGVEGVLGRREDGGGKRAEGGRESRRSRGGGEQQQQPKSINSKTYQKEERTEEELRSSRYKQRKLHLAEWALLKSSSFCPNCAICSIKTLLDNVELHRKLWGLSVSIKLKDENI